MQIAPKSNWLCVTLCAALFLSLALSVRISADENSPAKSASTVRTAAPKDTAANSTDSNGQPVKYIGHGSCAATSCHGSVKPVAGSRILQNEYSTWIVKDKHSRAFQ